MPESITNRKPFTHTSYFLMWIALVFIGIVAIGALSFVLSKTPIEPSERVQYIVAFIGLWMTLITWTGKSIMEIRGDVTRKITDVESQIALTQANAQPQNAPAATANLNINSGENPMPKLEPHEREQLESAGLEINGENLSRLRSGNISLQDGDEPVMNDGPQGVIGSVGHSDPAGIDLTPYADQIAELAMKKFAQQLREKQIAIIAPKGTSSSGGSQ